jgi:hypothetical protein
MAKIARVTARERLMARAQATARMAVPPTRRTALARATVWATATAVPKPLATATAKLHSLHTLATTKAKGTRALGLARALATTVLGCPAVS